MYGKARNFSHHFPFKMTNPEFKNSPPVVISPD